MSLTIHPSKKRPDLGFEIITRAKALELIENTDEASADPNCKFCQRRRNPKDTLRFQRIFEEERWDAYNGDTISISLYKGKEILPNGQNRVAGFAASGAKQAEFAVARGVRPESMRTRDCNGRGRTGADALYMATNANLRNRHMVASVAKFFVAFETAGGWQTLPPIGPILNEKVDTDLLVEAMEAEPIMEWICAETRRTFSPTWCPSHAKVAHCWHILRRRQDQKVSMVDEFFESTGLGLGLTGSTDPRFLLRRRMERMKGEMGGTNHALFVYYILRAYQAWANKESLAHLQAPKNEMRYLRPTKK